MVIQNLIKITDLNDTWYEQYFLFAVYRKLAESVTLCVRKIDFPVLVR